MDQTCLDKQSKGNAGPRVEKRRQGWAWCGRQGIARALSRYAPLCYAAQRHSVSWLRRCGAKKSSAKAQMSKEMRRHR
nr:MAG TPA: hypothetical protein [Caudoviricetes sp.]